MSMTLYHGSKSGIVGQIRPSSRVAELAESLGTRDSAERLRHIAENAIDNDGRRIRLDFAGVTSCSSAFADELVGKLVMKYGFVGFMERVSIRNLGGLSAMLVNSALAQRMAAEVPGTRREERT